MAARTRTTALFAAQVQLDLQDCCRSPCVRTGGASNAIRLGSHRVGVHLPFTSTRSSSVPMGI